ncbi:mitochondrial coenzyme A diphosphatase NUDT8-like [Vanessa atalanta]|uniref:mitochondrial coenzyme A diphosphatase NUDT8-like n=1 Tax=Vanessa atalanta TaxID=42275 RepID=UPI001FCDBC20|nr:mitochondrial coenzyme A diphosphatase NUDT8-like [Vanessa atalanta]
MSLSPHILLSNLARERCVAKLKDLPAFIRSDVEPKVKAAVLVPIFERNGELHILYTLRSSNLKSHSGQVSFPGGKIDENEKVIDAALRETYEEIGVPGNSVDVWCEMSPVQGRDRSILITPVVGVIKDLIFNNLNPNIHEVEEIFSVPISTFCDTANQAHLKYEGILLPVFLHGKHKIWGITGYITHFFLQCFLPSDLYNVDFTRKGYKLEELMPSKL